jgi:gamma-glutamylcyclotransferase (GGCT)/AIG2-like uncharacterized protein YtfP
MNTRKFYLAYGMNTNLTEMRKRCPSAKSLGKVKLENHKLAFKTFCDITPATGESMECVLWSITDNCERALDALEGYPEFYKKKEVSIKHNNQTIRAMIYYMSGFYDRPGMPSDSYLKTVAQGYIQHGIDLIPVFKALDEVPDKNEYHIG